MNMRHLILILLGGASIAARGTFKDEVFSQLQTTASSTNYYWAWTYPWIDHGKWSGDSRFAVIEGAGVRPKPTEEVSLQSVYQKYSDGKRAVINYIDLSSIAGTWHSDRYYRVNRATLVAAIRRQWTEFGGITVFNWHMDHPYCTNGFKAASYRFKSSGENRNVIRQILDGTGGPCGTDSLERKNHRQPCANPKEWYMRQLKDIVTFLKGLVDEETGERIPVILRYGHECDGDWFWWGRTWCTADEFRRFSRMTADYLRNECGEDQILFAYTPDRTWNEFGKEGDADNTFLAYYPGDAYVDILGLDDYSIGNGDDHKVESNFNETVRKLRLMTDFARDRGKVVCISEAGGKHKRDDFWQWLHRVATADGVKVAFVDTWSGEWGTLPATSASEADEIAFARRPETLMEDSGKGFRKVSENVGRIGPPDFDAFWKQAIERLEATTPLDIQMDLVPEKSKGTFNYYRFNFATYKRRMWGFLTVPKDASKGPYPFLLHIPGAGPYHSNWWGGNDKWITMMVNVLDFDPNGPDGIKKGYEDMCARLKAQFGYTCSGYLLSGLAASREEAFNYPVILGLNRIANWAWNRPDVDRSQFVVIGGSQGGFLSIALMGLNHKFTRGAPYVPTFGTLLANKEGLSRPLDFYPKEKHAAIRAIAPYFDTVHFAARVTTPVRGARGLADPVCSPSSTKAIFDAIASKEKYVIECPGMTHKVFPEVEKDLNAWVRSRTLKVNESAVPGDDPSIAVSGEFHDPKALAR